MKPEVAKSNTSKLEAFDRLLQIMDELRENCPWDKKQTMESLRHLTIEETFELSEAVFEGRTENIKKELGDLLLHIVFYARIASEKNDFTITDVIQALCEKLIYRHPHIYGTQKVKNEQEVKQAWEKLKLKEKGNQSVLNGVPRSLPALIKAMRIQEKASMCGFDWQKKEEAEHKVEEALQALSNEHSSHISTATNQARIQTGFGDLLFSLVNYARLIDVNPEEALEKANKKFIQRFQHMEKQIEKDGKQLAHLSLKEMNMYWEQTKQQLPFTL